VRAPATILKSVSGLLIVVGSLMLGGCGSAGIAAQTAQPTQSMQLPAARWQALAPPRSDLALLGYAVSPVDPTTIYACTSNGNSQNPITLWRTEDAAQHWSALHLPTASGTDCEIAIAPTQPQRIAVLLTNPDANTRPCDTGVLYLSNDGGKSWQYVPYTSIAPEGAQTVFCQITATTHYLFLTYSFSGEQKSPQTSLLERTDDNGASWTRVDTAFGPNALFLPPQVGADDTLALTAWHSPYTAKETPVLWMTHDGGNTWQQMGALPNGADTYLFAPPPTSASWSTATTSFYALAGEQIPSDLFRLRVFQHGNGQYWTALPPLPAPGVSASQPGLLQALTVTVDGRLLAFGVDPKRGLPGSTSTSIQQKMLTFWLWIWNPSTSRWQVLPTPLNHPADESCALCWFAQASTSRGASSSTYLYIFHWNDPDSFFRIRLPSI